MRKRERLLTLADMPKQLQRFRYTEWCRPGDAEIAADKSAPDGGQGYVTFLIALAHDRFGEARKAWVSENCPDESLSEMIERRHNRPADWFRTAQELRSARPER